MTIEIASSLIPGQTDTPLDARTRIASLADLATIVNPYVGMRIYALDTGKSHIVKTLKAKLIGALTVPDAQIDTVEETGNALEVAKKVQFAVPFMEDNSALHFTIEVHETSDYTDAEPIAVDTATDQTDIEVNDGNGWGAFPSEGIGSPFYESYLSFGGIPSELRSQCYLRYKFYVKGDTPAEYPWEHIQYPNAGVTGKRGRRGEVGTVTVVVSSTEPSSPADGTIWIAV